MIHFFTARISAEAPSGAAAYLEARCRTFERVLKQGAPNRDAALDEEKKQAFLDQQLNLANGAAGEEDPLALEMDADLNIPEGQDRQAWLDRIAGFQRDVHAVFPTLDGEEIREEQLARSGGRIYLKQKTNWSTLYFSDTSLRLPGAEKPAETAVQAFDATPKETEEAVKAALKKTVETAYEIAKLLNEFTPAPYKTVLSVVFGGFDLFVKGTSSSGHSSDNEAMIQRIGELAGKATWEANVKQTVKEKAGVIYSIVEGMAQHYGPQKKDGMPASDLTGQFLNPYLRDLDAALSTLEEEDFDVASLPEYCLGASTHFMVLQELAVLDPRHTADPFQSQWCGEIKTYWADKRIGHVRRTYEKLLASARKAVEDSTEFTNTVSLTRHMILCPSCLQLQGQARLAGLGWFYDNAKYGSYPDGFEYCMCHTQWAYDSCKAARSKWIADKQAERSGQVEKELAPLKQLADNQWSRLKTRPLYGSERIE